MPPVPWDQRADESAKAYAAFMAYCRLGPERTYKRVAEQFGRGAGLVRLCERWSTRYDWQERVRAFDAAEHARLNDLYADERIRERKRRIQSLTAGRTRLEQALVVLSPTDAKWGEVITGLSRINADLRTEHGDDPPQRVAIGQDPDSAPVELTVTLVIDGTGTPADIIRRRRELAGANPESGLPGDVPGTS